MMTFLLSGCTVLEKGTQVFPNCPPIDCLNPPHVHWCADVPSQWDLGVPTRGGLQAHYVEMKTKTLLNGTPKTRLC